MTPPASLKLEERPAVRGAFLFEFSSKAWKRCVVVVLNSRQPPQGASRRCTSVDAGGGRPSESILITSGARRSLTGRGPQGAWQISRVKSGSYTAIPRSLARTRAPHHGRPKRTAISPRSPGRPQRNRRVVFQSSNSRSVFTEIPVRDPKIRSVFKHPALHPARSDGSAVRAPPTHRPALRAASPMRERGAASL